MKIDNPLIEPLHAIHRAVDEGVYDHRTDINSVDNIYKPAIKDALKNA